MIGKLASFTLHLLTGLALWVAALVADVREMWRNA